MRKLDIIKTTVLAALAAAPFIAMTGQSASAQRVVAANCPAGYTLSGNSCVKSGPVPTCPSGFGFSGGKCVASTPVAAPAAKSPTTKSTSGSQWAFITWKSFGVKTVTELDGANFCAPANSPSADDAKDFFKEKGLTATHVKVDNNRAGIEKYQKFDCDVLVVADRVASATADSLKPAGDHLVLPEKFGDAGAAPAAPVAAPVTPAPLPPKPPATVKKKPAPKKTVRKKRCSGIRYAYTRGNSCSCAGGRVFTGNACVRPRRQMRPMRYMRPMRHY